MENINKNGGQRHDQSNQFINQQTTESKRGGFTPSIFFTDGF